MDEKQLQALYEAMNSRLGLGDYNQFKNTISTDDKFRRAFYDEASHELYLGDYTAFDNSVKKKENGIGSILGGIRGTSSGLLADVRKVKGGETFAPEEKELTLDENDPIGSLQAQVLNKTMKFHNVGGDMQQQKFKMENKKAIEDGRGGDDLLPDVAGKLMTKAKQNVFQTTDDAERWLKTHAEKNGGSISPQNQTAKIAIDQINDKQQLVNSIDKFNGDLINASKDYFAGKDDLLGKKLRMMNGNIPPSLQGELMQGFLNTKGVQEWAQQSQQNHNSYMEQKDNFYQNYPQLRVKDIVSKIAQFREDNDFNNPILNVPGAKSSDKVMDELVKKGELSVFDKEFYEKAIRPAIQSGAIEIQTPGLIESGLKSGGEAISDLPKGLYELTGVHSLISNKADDVYDQMEKDAEQPNVKFKGINNVSNIIGNLAGVVVPIGGEAKLLKTFNVVKDAEKANQLAMMATFYHGLYEDNLREMPNDPQSARVAATLQTLVYGYISKTLPKIAKDVVSESSPEIKQIVKQLGSGEISGNAAAQKVTETALGKALSVAKTVGEGAENNVKMALEMGLAENINSHIKGAFSGRFDAQETGKNMLHTMGTMLIGGGPLSLLGAIKKNFGDTNADVLNEIAEKPEPFKEHIGEISQNDPEFAKKAPEYLKNLDHLIKIHEILKEDQTLNESQRKKFQLLSLNEKILSEKVKATPDKGLAGKDEKQIAAIQIEKEKVLNPEMSNTELIEKHYDEELIPKGMQKSLEGETGKFEPNKVGKFLKELAEKAKDPEKVKDVPEPLIEIAKERWPEGAKEEPEVEKSHTDIFNKEMPLEKKYKMVEMKDPITGEAKQMSAKSATRTMEKRHQMLDKLINCLTK